MAFDYLNNVEISITKTSISTCIFSSAAKCKQHRIAVSEQTAHAASLSSKQRRGEKSTISDHAEWAKKREEAARCAYTFSLAAGGTSSVCWRVKQEATEYCIIEETHKELRK